MKMIANSKNHSNTNESWWWSIMICIYIIKEGLLLLTIVDRGSNQINYYLR